MPLAGIFFFAKAKCVYTKKPSTRPRISYARRICQLIFDVNAKTSSNKNMPVGNEAIFEPENPGLIMFGVDANAPTAFPYNSTHYANPLLVLPFGFLALTGIASNISLFLYIFMYRLYTKFISSQFIMHLCGTNLFGLILLLPMFLYSLWTGRNLWENSDMMCRIQVSLLKCSRIMCHILGFIDVHCLVSNQLDNFMYCRCSFVDIRSHSL